MTKQTATSEETLYSTHTADLCIQHDSHNNHRLSTWTALANWYSQWILEVFTVRNELNF